MRRILGLGAEVSGTRASWFGSAVLISAMGAASIAAFACGPKTDAPPETPSAEAPVASAAPTAAPTDAVDEGAGGAAGAPAEAPVAEATAPAAETTTAPPAEPPPAAPSETKPKEEAPKEGTSVEKPCLASSFSIGSVKSACASGGVPAAKQMMKNVMAKANKSRAEDAQMKCVSCHSDTSKFGLKANAVADLRAIL